jgi:hypothetical protein
MTAEPATEPAGEPDDDTPTSADLKTALRALASASAEYDALHERTSLLAAQLEPHLTGRVVRSHRPGLGQHRYLVTALRVEPNLQVYALGFRVLARGVGYTLYELGTIRPEYLDD